MPSTRNGPFGSIAFALLCFAISQAGQIARADFVSSYAAINLLDQQPGSFSNAPNTTVQTSAAALGASASSQASTNGQLASSSSQPGIGLVYNAGADSGYGATFSVLGNDGGTLLPLSFNYSFGGSLGAASLPDGGVAVASVNYNAESSAAHFKGSFGITSQFGIPTTHVVGSFPGGQTGATVTPQLQIGIDLQPLLPQDLQFLGIAPSWETNLTLPELQTDQFSGVAAEIATAIFNVGLARLNVLPGVNLKVGVDVEFTFQSAFSIEVPTTGGIDFLLADVSTSATASPGARAASAYMLAISSVTVPHDFNQADLSQLQVVFGSGLTLPVTRAVPEPTSLRLLAGAGVAILLACARHRRLRVRSGL